MSQATTYTTDTIELGDILRVLRRGWLAVVGFTVVGALAAAAVIFVASPKFFGHASLVLKTGSDPSGSLLGRLTGGLGDAAGGVLGGALKSPMETELQILQSESIAGKIVDSLLLQARIRAPRSVAPTAVFSSLALKPAFSPQKYHFVRSTNGAYAFSGPSGNGTATPGTAATFALGSITLRPGIALPAFDVELRDREDAIARLEKYLVVDKAGGEVAKVEYRGDDSLTAAAVPNAVIGVYLARRTTIDRGVNQHQLEFLTAKTDSAAQQLALAERELRQQQERSGVIDPETVGKMELQQASQIRASAGELQVEDGAIRQLIARVNDGSIRPRELAAYPTFLKSPGVNDLIGQLSQVETERYKLLESRTENDPEVVALTQSAQNIEGQLLPMARSYAASVSKQRSDVERQLDSVQTQIKALPGVAESGLRLQREVIRQNQVYAALSAQLVQAKLAAITEGGDVRPLDAATPPKKPVFPDPLKVGAMGIAGGLACGVLAALFIGMLGRWMQEPSDVERLTGLPAFRLEGGAPLFLGGSTASTVLVLPIDASARTEPVARQIVETALARSLSATILDLSGAQRDERGVRLVSASGTPAMPISPSIDANASIDRLEAEHSVVVVRLPGLDSRITAAVLRPSRPVVLVAPERRIDRGKLLATVQTLQRLDIPCAGVVLSGAPQKAVLVG